MINVCVLSDYDHIHVVYRIYKLVLRSNTFKFGVPEGQFEIQIFLRVRSYFHVTGISRKEVGDRTNLNCFRK